MSEGLPSETHITQEEINLEMLGTLTSPPGSWIAVDSSGELLNDLRRIVEVATVTFEEKESIDGKENVMVGCHGSLKATGSDTMRTCHGPGQVCDSSSKAQGASGTG